jgi:hypothetical protein
MQSKQPLPTIEQSMEIIKNNNGFPYSWKAGRVEQLIRSLLEAKAKQQLNVNRVMVINPTWMHEDNIQQDIKDRNPDFIICHNFVDPAVPKIFDAIETSGVPYIILGNADQYRIDFWAIVCDLYFQNYEEHDVAIRDTARKYICLNRKPHPHRMQIVNQLISAGLQDQGYLSLGLPNNPIVLDEEFADEQGIKDEYGNLGVDETFVSRQIRNDIFSVGNDNIWRDSYLCLVTETEFSNANPANFFISEKTWKPIIGMRPFFVYGQPMMRQYLEDQGFDIFSDIFDYARIDNTMGDVGQQMVYSQVAIDAINSVKNPAQEYQRYFGRCQNNKKRFRSYVYEQWDKLNALDLREFI